MNTSETLKELVDNFGRLSFVLETYVKLSQTGDHRNVLPSLLQAAKEDADKVLSSIEKIESYE